MKPQHIIYRVGNTVVLYTWDRVKYESAAWYSLPDGNPATIVDYLRRTPASTIAIIVDVMEEEHSRDTIARLGRNDQAAMLARKLTRTFPRTAYRTAILQGRSSADPKATQVLLSGLTKPDHLRELMRLLIEARLPVASICSPALLSRPLVEKLRPANPANATILVTRHIRGGLRLTFFRDRELVGSRLMRRAVAAAPGDMPRLVSQIDESLRYFDAAFAPSATTPLDVILLCETGLDGPEAMRRGLGHEGYRLHIPDPALAARKLGLRAPLVAGNANLLFVELLRHYAPLGNFSPAPERQYFRLFQARSVARAACLALAASALLAASLDSADLLEAHHEAQDVAESVAELTRVLDVNNDSESINGADPLEMQRAVASWSALRQHNVEPEAVFSLVGAAVERRPLVQLDALQWSPLALIAIGNESDDQAGNTATNSRAAESPRVRISVRARVEPFDGNYRLAFAEMQHFMDALRADPRVYSVTARQQPLDVNPQSTLTGEVTTAKHSDSATFTLDLLVRFNNESA